MDKDIKTLAKSNPKLAYMLSRGLPLTPRWYNVELRWDSPAANQSLRGVQLLENMYQMFWVKHLLYTVRRPQCNSGVFWQRFQDEYVKLNPYVDVSFRSSGREKLDLTNSMTPLELLATPSSSQQVRQLDWVITEDSNISIDAVNMRAFQADEVPYIVTLSFVGMETTVREGLSLVLSDIVCKLQDEGIL